MITHRGSSHRSRRRWLLSLVALLGAVGGLVVAEVILRVLGLGYGNAPLVSDPLLHHAHERNYHFLAHTPSGEFGGYEVYFDVEGRIADPQRRLVYDPSRHHRPVAFMGDSLVEALQVPYAATFVGLLNRNARPDVFVTNFGVAGYSPVLYLIQWRQAIRKEQPKHVFLMLSTTDAREDAGYFNAARLGADGLPAAVPGPGKNHLTMMLRRSYVARLLRKFWLTFRYRLTRAESAGSGEVERVAGGFVEEHSELGGITERCLVQLVREVQGSGTRFTLTAVPSAYETLHPGDKIPGGAFADHVRRWAESNGVDYLDLSGPFSRGSDPAKKPFFDRDPHFNATGHELIARAMATGYPELFKP